MKLAIVAIGIPGSGKTTALVPLAARHSIVRISRDEIRQEMFGDPLDRSGQEKVWQEADRRTRDAFAAGKNVILDSTFADRKKREHIIAAVRAAGADRVIGIMFNTPVEVAKERNREREHVVQEEVIDTVFAQITAEPPALSDGFDALYTSDELDALEASELAG